MEALYNSKEGTEGEIQKKIGNIPEKKGYGTIIGVFIPNASNV